MAGCWILVPARVFSGGQATILCRRKIGLEGPSYYRLSWRVSQWVQEALAGSEGNEVEKLLTLFLLVMGVLVVIYAVRAFFVGEVRAGHNFGTPIFYSRGDSPLRYYLFVLIYLGGGLWAAVYALMVMFGLADPLPLQ